MTLLWTWEHTIPRFDIRLLPYLKKAFYLSLPDENYLDELAESDQHQKPNQNLYFVISDISGESNQYIKCVSCKFSIKLQDDDLESEYEEPYTEIIENWLAKFVMSIKNPRDYR